MNFMQSVNFEITSGGGGWQMRYVRTVAKPKFPCLRQVRPIATEERTSSDVSNVLNRDIARLV